MEIAQLLLSLLHAWGLDSDLDRLCEATLGLLKPMVPVSFGVISKGGVYHHFRCHWVLLAHTTFVILLGYMSLLLPTWQLSVERKTSELNDNTLSMSPNLSKEMVEMERLTRKFTAQLHWELSTSLTSNHLLAIIALANTLMSMNNASFVAEQERNRKLQRWNVQTVEIIKLASEYRNRLRVYISVG